MTLDIRNPHDRFFKETFSRLEVSRSFLKNYLPSNVGQQLDLSNLELQKESFTDKTLQQHFSDLLIVARGLEFS